MSRELPVPAAQRWQPLRAGLVDLFYYDVEEFWFRDGRLLLRGNNGTGKSKVLALMLPFLLDGDLSAHRVEPDADPKKKMEWNLLLGGTHPNSERLGYTWLEFGRLGDDGEPEFRTIGCGMKAVEGRGIAKHWYFVTSGRVDGDYSLVDATGTALSRERLIDTIGAQQVYDKARDYRRAVDENLFGFGEQRYSALVDLLVQLRQPQLSKRPSERALSTALTEALPPLDQAVLADVAEAFRSLEEDRDALAAMAEARDAASSFLIHYRHYARIAARRKAALPRTAQSSYERLSGELAKAEAAYAEADEQLTAAQRRQRDLESEAERLRERDRTLQQSPEMRNARELERAAEDERRLGEQARQLADDEARAAERVTNHRGRCEEARTRLSEARDELHSARQGASDAAGAALLVAEHTEQIDERLTEDADLPSLRRGADELLRRQQAALKHVKSLLDRLTETGRELAEARAKVSELDSEAGELGERRSAAEQAVAHAGAELVAAVREHFDGARELALPDSAAVLAELELWVETQDGANPAAAAVSVAGHEIAGRLARADAELDARVEALQTREGQLREEISRLERGEDTAPPAPHTRDGAARADRPGAPLWQLVDFVEEVADDDRAGLEAALEAAGVLDGWVNPDGEVLAAGTEDVVVHPGERPEVALDSVLRPAVDRENDQAAAVSDDTVARVLASIGVGEYGHTWVEADGRYGIGVLAGAWHKAAAQYIGRGAREAARRARLDELRSELSTVEAELAELVGKREEIATRQQRLSDEVSALPSDAAVGKAHARVDALRSEQERLAEKQQRAAETVTAATARHDTARAELHEAAGDARLPAEAEALSEAEQGLADYRQSLADVWHTWQGVRDKARRVADAAADLEQADEERAEIVRRSETVADQAEAAAEHHRTLRETVGAAVAELQQKLADVAEALRANTDAHGAAATEAEQARDARGKADGHRERLAAQLDDATRRRAEAAEAFQRFASTGLLAVALPELKLPDSHITWAPDPAVRLARRVNDDLTDVADDDNAWDRVQHRLNNELKALQDTMSRRGNKASADLRDDGVVVEVEFQGRPATVPELVKALDAEVADRERLLSEREREVLENHLVNEVASTLQELISAAEAQVAQMNEELSARPMSTGMRLRLLWRPSEDGPTGLAAARERLLRQTADAWSEEDRSAVGGFLQERISDVRMANPSGTWLEQLSEALDYRKWHRFVIERHQNGQWRSATGPASGGERVLAASVPLFAAASSHYASAGSPHAPRLVTLDEAFAGVDDNARAKYLGLLAAFDLDVVMTSEREWGCYPEVPGLAISHLQRTEDVAAVLVTSWEWDGYLPRKVDRGLHAEGEDGLWSTMSTANA